MEKIKIFYIFGCILCAICIIIGLSLLLNCGKLKTLSCPTPEPPANGFINGMNFKPGQNLTFGCFSGYRAYGINGTNETSLHCNENGEWIGHIPICQMITCPGPKSPENGKIIGSDFTYERSVTFECLLGYEIKSTSKLNDLPKLYCGENGEWIGQIPECQKIICPDPKVPENGKIIGTDFTFGNTITYVCSHGYELKYTNNQEGITNPHCDENGEWIGEFPICQVITCPEPKSLENGKIIGSDFTFGKNVTFECSLGYDLNSTKMLEETPKLYCGENGEWIGQTPICQKITCPDPKAPKNGKIIGTDFTFGNTVTYECYRGYELKTLNTAEKIPKMYCDESGEWIGEFPQCQIIICPDPKVPENGKIIGSDFHFGKYISFECSDGYKLETLQESKLYCDENGKWIGEIPICQILTCPPLRPIANTRIVIYHYGVEVNYACQSGYKLSEGDLVRKCQKDESWSGRSPRCELILCSTPDIGNNAYISSGSGPYYFGDKITYSCGYRYVYWYGDSERTCTKDGTWSGSALHCKIILCSTPDIGNNAYISSGSGPYYFGDKITYSCRYTYVYWYGNSERTCTKDGTWSGSALHCKRRRWK